MEVFLALDIPPFVMYCVNGKPRSSLFIVYRLYDSMMNRIVFEIIYIYYSTEEETAEWKYMLKSMGGI